MPDAIKVDELTEAVDGRYGRLRIFSNDAVIGAALRLYGEWAENELKLARRLIGAGAVVLDVGAYIGTHALAFSRMVGPEGRVVSIEPQPASFRLLADNMSANDCANVSLLRAAVGEHLGTIRLPPMDLAQRMNFGGATSDGDIDTHAAGASDVVCDVVTIDSLALSRCDFVKLDVEGAESLALAGAARTIERCQPIVYAESNNIESAAKTLAVLKSYGYRALIHVVDAFNEDNFNAERQNIFGDAREAGILAVPARRFDRLEGLTDRTWHLFDAEVLDDVVYAMLQKPQYFDEYLRCSSAARRGGMVVSAPEFQALRGELDRATHARDDATARFEECRRHLDDETTGRRRAEAEREALAQAMRLQTERLEETANRLLGIQKELHALREDSRRDQATIERLQLVAHAFDEVKRSRLYGLLDGMIAREMRVRHLLRERRRRRRERRRGRTDEGGQQEAGSSTSQPGGAPGPAVTTLEILPIGDGGNAECPNTRPLMVCVSHVSPWPPRAGNEYRIQRMLAWVRSAGWDVALVLCPLAGQTLTESQLLELAAAYENLLVVDRGGRLRTRVARSDLAAATETLRGRRVRDFADVLAETRSGRTQRILEISRSFCPDVLVEVLSAIAEVARPGVVHVNYAFMTRCFPILGGSVLKVVDTHDVFSSKAAKVVRFGIEDTLSMSPPEESSLLRHSDVLIAIQPQEADELQALLPDARVITIGVDMPQPPASSGVAKQPVLLMVGSANAMNQKGLKDFLRFAWPIVRDAVPDAQLRIVGSVGRVLSGHEQGVRWLGMVDALDDAYADARVVINPAVAGTGLKIKTLEALSHLRPIVLWPSGVDGLSDELRAFCECVTNWFEFSDAVVRLLVDHDAGARLVASRDRIGKLLSPEHVYADYGKILATHAQR